MRVLFLLVFLFGCAPTGQQIKEAIDKNPEIITDFIKKNPEQVIMALNEASLELQKKQKEEYFAQEQRRLEDEMKNPKSPKLGADRVYFGSPEAPITIVKYSDFECPFCRRGYKTLENVKEKYGEKVRVIYKHVPLQMHPMARPAAQYYEALSLQGHQKARKFYHRVFEEQTRISESGFLKNIARDIGADMKRLQQDLRSERVENAIKDDLEEFKAFGYTGTPVFLVNGVTLSGAQPLVAFEKVIDRQLAKVKN